MNIQDPSTPALLESVMTASQNGVLVYQVLHNPIAGGDDLRLTMLNAIAERDLGRPAIDILGQPFGRMFPHLAESGLLDRYRRVLDTGQSARFEFDYARPSQASPLWLDISAVRMEDSIVVSYNDITQIKADAEAARLANVLQQAFDASISGITVFEAVRDEQDRIDDFRFTMINEAGLRMSGYTRAELIGRTLWEIYPATGINGLFDQYVQVYETGQPFSGEHYYPEYDLWRESTVVPVQGGVMVTYLDITPRKKAEEATKQQTDLLQGILESVPVGILVLSAVRLPDNRNNRITDFRIFHINSILKNAVCEPGTSVVGQLLTYVFSTVTESGILSRCIMAVELGRHQEFEMPYIVHSHKNWYRVSMAPKGDRLILAITNITDIKLAQLAHHRQAELLQSLSDNTPAGLVLWEAVYDDTPDRNVIDFRYRMTNLMNTFVTGYSAEALVGHRLLELFPRFRGTEMEAVLREVLQTGRTQRMIFTYYTEQPGGWFDAQFMRVGNEVLMTFMDVTQQHKIQLEQKKQADFVQAVINSQPVGVAVFDPVRETSADGESVTIVDFTYALVNETEVRVTGRTAEEMLGQRFLTLFPSEQGHEFFEMLARVAETGESIEQLVPYSSDGINGWFQSSLKCQGDQILFTFLDVSELKRQQQALEVANIELHRSNENLQQFAYVASHDLQEPLRKIQSFGDMLATTYATVLDEPALNMISRMQSAAQRMSELIRDLLNYSRVSTHRAPFEPVPLVELLTNTINDLFMAINESGATIDYGELPILYGDKMQFRQLFQNLLSNAIKFRAPGTSPQIKLASRTLTARDIPAALTTSIVAADNESFHEITVSDNGIGFDEKYLDRIFQVFQRLHGRNEYAGTGVGLAICQKVAENHHGVLTATSQVGVGTTFRLYLPITI